MDAFRNSVRNLVDTLLAYHETELGLADLDAGARATVQTLAGQGLVALSGPRPLRPAGEIRASAAGRELLAAHGYEVDTATGGVAPVIWF